MKTEVYSWRVSPEVKIGLERAARRRNISLSKVLDLAAREWLMKSDSDNQDGERQRKIQEAASECFGVFASGNARRSETAGKAVRQRVLRRHGR